MSELTGTNVTDAPAVSVTDREISEAIRGGAAQVSGSQLPQVSEGMSTWDSAGFAFGEWSTVGAGIMATGDVMSRPDFNELNQDFIVRRSEWEAADEARKSTLDEMRKLQDSDPSAYEMLKEYEWALNPQAAEFWLQRYHQAKEIRRDREESGGFGYALGATAAVIVDSLIINVGAAPSLANSARSAAWNAVKYAAPELAFDAAARDAYDPTYTTSDFAMQLAIGVPAAAGVGAGLNKIMNRGTTKVIDDQAFVESADDLAHKSGGAARVEDYTDMTVQRSGGAGADLGFISRVLDKPGLNVMRGPKGVLKTLRKAVSGGKHTELEEVISSFDRMWKSSELTEGVRKGQPMREAMEEGLNRVRAEMQVHLKQTDDMIDKWMDGAYGKASRILKPLSDFLPGQRPPTRAEIKSFGSKLSVAKDNSTKWDARIDKLRADIDKINDSMDKAIGKADGAEIDTANFQARIDAKEALAKSAELNRQKAVEALQELEGEINTRGLDAGDAEGFTSLVNNVSGMRDNFYLKQGQRLAADGLIDEKNLRPGYRVQSWEPEQIASNPTEFRTLLWQQLAENGPDEEFINDYLTSLGKAEGVTARNMDDLIEENPSLAREVQESFEDAVQDGIEERAAQAAADINAEFGAKGREAAEAFIERADQQIVKNERLVREHQEAWDKLPRKNGKPSGSFSEVESKWRLLQKAEVRLQEWSTRRDMAQQMLNNERTLVDLYASFAKDLNKVSDFRLRASQGRLRKSLAGLEVKTEKAKAQAMLSQRIDDIYEEMSGGRTGTTFEADEYLQTSARFKRRSIDLNGVHHKPKWQKFLKQGDDDILIGYTENVSRQAELEEKMGSFLRDQGVLKEGDHNVADAWLRWAGRKVDEAILANPVDKDELVKFKERIVGLGNEDGMLGSAIKEFTRQDRLSMYKTTSGRALDQGLGITSTLMNAMLLGRVALTLPTDMATTFSGGQRSLTGFKAMTQQLFRGNLMGGIDNVDKADALLAMTIRGEHVVAASDMAARFDADNFMMAGAGSMARKIEATRQGIGYVASWSNFMTPWNRFVRSSVALDAAAEIVTDAANRKNMSASLRAAYASAGLGDDVTRGINDLDAINALVKKMGTINQSGSKVPNTSKWHSVAVVFDNGKARVVKASEVPEGVVSVSGEHMQNKYLSAVRTFANQMHLDPALGDRPFWSKAIHGRIIMSMQSFMYAAADRFVQPAIERMAMDKVSTASRFMGAAMLGIGLGALGQGARDKLAGNDTPFTEGPKDAEETWEILRVGFRRSPMSIGMLDRFWEAGSVMAGDHINDAVGFKVVDETPVKYRHGQDPLAAMLGPAAGTLTRVGKMAGAPEDQSWEKISKMVPIFNSLWFQSLMSIMD